jgi:hypothetical protein
MLGRWLLLLVLAGGCLPPAQSVYTLPSLALNSSLVGSTVVQSTFIEGKRATNVTRPGEVAVTGIDAPVIAATIVLNNLLDAPYEVLRVTPAPSVSVAYNASSGLLKVDATKVVPVASATAAVAATLGTLTYDNTSPAPSGSARVLVCTVTDVNGAVSTPAVAVVNVIPVNAPPVLILADPASYASGLGPNFTAVLYESERTTPVALAAPSMVLTDVDNVIMPKAVLTLTGALDGNVEVRQAFRILPSLKHQSSALHLPADIHLPDAHVDAGGRHHRHQRSCYLPERRAHFIRLRQLRALHAGHDIRSVPKPGR